MLWVTEFPRPIFFGGFGRLNRGADQDFLSVTVADTLPETPTAAVVQLQLPPF